MKPFNPQVYRKGRTRVLRPDPESCVHHWFIGPACGPTSRGICKKCGKKREFSNDLFPVPKGLYWE